jgi:hypothetical protein
MRKGWRLQVAEGERVWNQRLRGKTSVERTFRVNAAVNVRELVEKAELGIRGGVPFAASFVKALRCASTADAALRGLDCRLRCGCWLDMRSMSAPPFSREPECDCGAIQRPRRGPAAAR